MHVPGSSSATAATTLLLWLVQMVSSISVPTGKLTPITPARPTPVVINPRAPAAPAPVVEYTQDDPEPPPLDPSYVPVTYNYFDTLARHHVYYVPMRFPNYNAADNSIDYEPRHKNLGQTLGKNIAYKPYKQQVPVRTWDWARQFNNQYNGQQQPNNVQYNGQQQPNELYNIHNADQNSQFSIVQPTPQQQYQAVSTQSSAVTTGSVQPPTTVLTTPEYRKVDYTTGKGSYDLTGKGGSSSEYYTKGDWSKKTAYPKKVPSHGLTPTKYGGQKY